MIRHPYQRFLVFESLFELRILLNLREVREYAPTDSYGLIETIESIHDFVPDPTAEELGEILFDDAERAVFEKLSQARLNDQALCSDWETLKSYMDSAAFQAYLQMASDCLWTMLGPGRGIPGWYEDEGDI